MGLEITDSNLEEIVNGNENVLIMFGASWCGPCKMLTPIVESLSNEYEGKVKIGKVDVDENAVSTTKYGIRNVPTLLFIKNGEVVEKQVGAAPKSALVGKLDNLL